jgi:hypothetical protein
VFECPFLTTKQINTYQKLGLLFWLDQHDDAAFSLHELADRTYLADLPLLERSLSGLMAVGLVAYETGRYRLVHHPETDYCLACLASTFESPLPRQGLLACIDALGGGRDTRPE